MVFCMENQALTSLQKCIVFYHNRRPKSLYTTVTYSKRHRRYQSIHKQYSSLCIFSFLLRKCAVLCVFVACFLFSVFFSIFLLIQRTHFAQCRVKYKTCYKKSPFDIELKKSCVIVDIILHYCSLALSAAAASADTCMWK